MKITINIKQIPNYDGKPLSLDHDEFKKTMDNDIDLIMECWNQWYGMYVDKIDYDFTVDYEVENNDE